jgi:hypothetical protein
VEAISEILDKLGHRSLLTPRVALSVYTCAQQTSSPDSSQRTRDASKESE